MKSVIIILSVLLITFPSKANADHKHESATLLWALPIGIPAVIGSTVIFPLIGKYNDRKNPPYWKAVGFTFLASAAGGGLALKRAEGCGRECSNFIHIEVIGYPIVFGSVATYFTYRLSSPKTDKTSNALLQYAPQVSVSPFARGGSIRLNWFF